ncbi:hypothetical protein [Hyphomicrobium sp. CS1GBMeth3]|uniref:hypothetical protein n=1 Tax=Hyphomicrobium sp. CS1GBMeth3 TaxID=1892845 RepID=UPI000930F6C1|nr:hypothetical protein [Hyphomicrobium sp. CS1GBMeth3]
MRAVVVLVAALFPLALASAQAQEGLTGADPFKPGAGRTWFSSCELQAGRYVSCKNAARPILEAIANPGKGTAGEALQAFMRDLFVSKGCTFEVPEDSFRVNGIFLSFDSHAAEKIRCYGHPSKLTFGPGVMALTGSVYFFMGGPPE